jgi:hypothetical protein
LEIATKTPGPPREPQPKILGFKNIKKLIFGLSPVLLEL